MISIKLTMTDAGVPVRVTISDHEGTEFTCTPGEIFEAMMSLKVARDQLFSEQTPLGDSGSEILNEIEKEKEKEGNSMAEPTSSETPFGTFSTDVGKTPAPTKQQVAAEPGKYDGTSFNPLRVNVPTNVIKSFATDAGISGKDDDGNPLYKFGGGTFAEWFKIDPHAALNWFQQSTGFGLELNNLSNNQMIEMGLLEKDKTKK